jgi:hypothetical protein
MVVNIENNLCIYLNFLDELDLVKILAVTNDWGHRIAVMGAVKGKEQLVDLLNEADIDHYTVGGVQSNPSFAKSMRIELCH